MDPTEPWNCLHGGLIVELDFRAGALRITIELPVVTRQIDPAIDRLEFVLDGFERIQYQKYISTDLGGIDPTAIVDLTTIVAQRPDIVEATLESNRLCVHGSRGLLTLQYQSLKIQSGTHHDLTFQQLSDASRARWDAVQRQLSRHQ